MNRIKLVFVDEYNNNILKEYFDDIRLQGNFILVKDGRLWGLYENKKYSQILTPEWDKVIIEQDCIVAIDDNKKSNVFDFCGNRILKGKYDKVSCYAQGLIVTRNSQKGLFSYDGKVILDIQWKKIEVYSQCIVAYKGNGKRKTVFDYNGKELS